MSFRSAVIAAAALCALVPVASRAEDLPSPPSPTASLLIVRHQIMLKDPLDLRPTPYQVGLVLVPGRIAPAYSDQSISVFVIEQPGEYQVYTADLVFRTKRQSGLVGNSRGLKPEDRYLMQVHEYEVGQMALPVAAGTVTFAGTLKLRLRRDSDNNSSAWGVTPGIESGEWLDSEPGDEEDALEEFVAGTAWKDRKPTRMRGGTP